MSSSVKSRYFDERAESWNEHADIDAIATLLDEGICDLDIGSDEVVMDLGCGTGVLTKALLRHLSTRGRVVAVDFSPGMLARAKSTIQDPRVTWLCDDARRICAESHTIDRVIAFAAWPHFELPELVLAEMRRLLRDNGKLHIWHKDSRPKVNAVHARRGHPVDGDILPPADEVALLLASCGFATIQSIDTEERYLVSATKA